MSLALLVPVIGLALRANLHELAAVDQLFHVVFYVVSGLEAEVEVPALIGVVHVLAVETTSHE